MQFVLVNAIGGRRAGEVLDDVQNGPEVFSGLTGLGGVLVALPNTIIEAAAERAAAAYAKGAGDDIANGIMLAAFGMVGSNDHLVLVDSADVMPDFLAAKLAAGAGIVLTVLNPGGNEQVQITATPTGPAGGDLGGTYPNPTFAKLATSWTLVTAALTTGTTQPLSISDATMTGLVAGGVASGITGTTGLIAHSFGSAAAETGTGAGQGGLGSAAAAGQPLNAGDFPGQHFQCEFLKVNGQPIALSDIVLVPPATDIDSPVYGYLSFRSDLGANLKWRLWFYYRSQVTGTETPINTIDTSLLNVILYAPQVFMGTNQPTAAGLGIPVASTGAAEIVVGVVGDIQPLAAAAAAGASGRVADAAHVHLMPRLDQVLNPMAARTFNNQDATGLKAITYNSEIDEGNSGASKSLDWTTSLIKKLTLTNNTVTLTFTAPVGPCWLQLKLIQDGTGSRTVSSWPTMKWLGGIAPVLTTTATTGTDLIAIYYDGSAYWGSAGLGYA